MTLPTDSKARKGMPLFQGCMMYFPDALLAIAEHSRKANEKHNPGEPLHWSKDKSNDHADCAARHLVDIGPEWDAVDPEFGSLHAVALAWRALALAQTVIERKRAGATADNYSFVKTTSLTGPAAARPAPTASEILRQDAERERTGAIHVTAILQEYATEADGPSSIPEFLKKHKE